MSSQSPRALAADVIALLMNRGVIVSTEDNLSTIHRAVSVTREDLKEAGVRRRAAGWFNNLYLAVEPTDRRTNKPRSKPVPRPAGMAKASAKSRKQRTTASGLELWCTAAKGELGEPHFAPEEAFIPKSDRPWTRHSLCDDHRRMYQRARHVRVSARKALGEAGIEFVLDAESNIVGSRCTTCGDQFAGGDRVRGDAVLHHAACSGS